MDKCREEFEKIEWVKERLKHVWWSQNNEYCDTGKHPRANASFLNGALHLFREQQAKVEELQTLYTKQGINMLKLQKRVDAAIRLIESWNEIAFDKTTHWTEGYEEGCYHCAAQLEQALKGEG
ncbi:hypothetical protein OHW53_11605 [Acinetobacter baumannii]|nr:hypothetical protein [Acinetobacter baumannii]